MKTNLHCISSMGAGLPYAACRVLPALLVGTLLLAPAWAQHHLYTFNGSAAGDVFGRSVSGAGDVNGDHHADVIVGAPWDQKTFPTRPGSARVLSGKDGMILYTFSGGSAGESFGWSVSGGEDINLDGFPDFVVGAPWDSTNGAKSGSVRVLSGKWIVTRAGAKVLHTFYGGAAGDLFGSSVRVAGDVNGDSYPDFVVGAQGRQLTHKGYARVFSGKWIATGQGNQILFTWRGGSTGDSFGISVSGAGDVNKDGYADVIVGAPGEDSILVTDSGSVRVFSGWDGTILHKFVGDSANDWFGRAVSGGADVNLDSYPDVIVGAPDSPVKPIGIRRGYVRALSGKWIATKQGTQILHTFKGSLPYTAIGWSSVSGGDVNRDGFSDVIVGAPWSSNNGKLYSGSVYVFSGLWIATKVGRQILYRFYGNAPGDRFGVSVSVTGDVNRDKFNDLIVGAYYASNNGTRSGSTRILSGKPLSLWTDTHQLSLKKAGTQKLSLDAGAQYANRSYMIVGSATGVFPDVTLEGVHIPLIPDVYTDITLGILNPPIFVGFNNGRLDSMGNAAASFNVPSQLPTLPGFTLYHAYLVLGSQNQILMSSNYSPLRLN